MRKLTAAATAAALLCGAAAMSPAKAVQGPGRGAVPGDVHQFVFSQGKAAYYGPLSERLGINGALKDAPELDAPAAYAAAIDASFRRMGAPVERVGRAGSHDVETTSVMPGRDWDGDGTADALALSGDGEELRVAAVKGTTGAELWSRQFPGYGMARAAVVGDGNGVLVWAYTGLDAVAARIPTLTVTAVDNAGRTVWETTYRGHYVYGVGVVAGRNLPLLADTGNLTASAADDVIVSKSTYAYSAAYVVNTERTTVDVLDGADGVPAFTASDVWRSYGLEAVAGPDLTGDGLDDVLLVGYSDLVALGGTDGQSLWSRSGLPVDYVEPQSVGDLNGDGVVELAVSPAPWDYPDEDHRTVAVSGADGTTLSAVEGALATDAGDVNGDGKADLSTVRASYDWETGAAGLTYQTFTGWGQRLASQVYSQTADWETEIYVYVWQVGDVQGDGSQDWAHSIGAYDEDGLRQADRGVISGRTNLRLWSGKAGQAIGGSMDGEGTDLLDLGHAGVQAQDGTTGRVLWTASVPRYSIEDQRALGDLDGDGKDEVGVDVFDYYSSMTVMTRVLSGADGHDLWRSAVIIPEPPVAIPEG